MDNAIFNIHVPPYGTGLDDAPELEDATTVKRGGGIMKPVGSTAVRDAILEYQPLLSLHGHIHESRGSQKLGRTAGDQPGQHLQRLVAPRSDRRPGRQADNPTDAHRGLTGGTAR